MAWKAEVAPGSRGYGDVAGASSDAGEADATCDDDDDDDDEGIPGRGMVGQDSEDRADKPGPGDFATDATPLPFRNAIGRAPRHPSCRSDRPWSAEPRTRHTRSNGRGTPGPWLASPAPRPGSLRGIGHIVSCFRTF